MPENNNVLFLGGTVASNKWREGFIQNLLSRGVAHSAIFNPVAGDFNPALGRNNPDKWEGELQQLEDEAKARPETITLFYIGDTKDGGGLSFYSNTEAIMRLYDDPERTIVAYDPTGIAAHLRKALDKTVKDLRKRFPDASIYSTLEEAENAVVARFGGNSEAVATTA
jgi:hypothetical protein